MAPKIAAGNKKDPVQPRYRHQKPFLKIHRHVSSYMWQTLMISFKKNTIGRLSVIVSEKSQEFDAVVTQAVKISEKLEGKRKTLDSRREKGKKVAKYEARVASLEKDLAELEARRGDIERDLNHKEYTLDAARDSLVEMEAKCGDLLVKIDTVIRDELVVDGALPLIEITQLTTVYTAKFVELRSGMVGNWVKASQGFSNVESDATRDAADDVGLSFGVEERNKPVNATNDDAEQQNKQLSLNTTTAAEFAPYFMAEWALPMPLDNIQSPTPPSPLLSLGFNDNIVEGFETEMRFNEVEGSGRVGRGKDIVFYPGDEEQGGNDRRLQIFLSLPGPENSRKRKRLYQQLKGKSKKGKAKKKL